MIISLSGRKGSGKTTLAKICQTHGYIMLNFGDELKKLTCQMLNITMEFLEENKNKPITNGFFYLKDHGEFLKKELKIHDDYNYLLEKKVETFRELLQYLGTEIIRTIDPDWHIKKIDDYIKANNLLYKNMVFADTRFKNELKYIQSLPNSTCWYILSPFNFKDISNHISETELNWMLFDNILSNENNYKTLYNWNNYLETFNKRYLEIYHEVPLIPYIQYTHGVNFEIIVHNKKLFLKINEQTKNFIKNFENLTFIGKNYYVIDNPYIIETIKLYYKY
jgi:hypothetical protein